MNSEFLIRPMTQNSQINYGRPFPLPTPKLSAYRLKTNQYGHFPELIAIACVPKYTRLSSINQPKNYRSIGIILWVSHPCTLKTNMKKIFLAFFVRFLFYFCFIQTNKQEKQENLENSFTVPVLYLDYRRTFQF